jgi:hypothetical protein
MGKKAAVEWTLFTIDYTLENLLTGRKRDMEFGFPKTLLLWELFVRIRRPKMVLNWTLRINECQINKMRL